MALYHASKLCAYLIPTPANLLIYSWLGYNLKIRCLTTLPFAQFNKMNRSEEPKQNYPIFFEMICRFFR